MAPRRTCPREGVSAQWVKMLKPLGAGLAFAAAAAGSGLGTRDRLLTPSLARQSWTGFLPLNTVSQSITSLVTVSGQAHDKQVE